MELIKNDNINLFALLDIINIYTNNKTEIAIIEDIHSEINKLCIKEKAIVFTNLIMNLKHTINKSYKHKNNFYLLDYIIDNINLIYDEIADEERDNLNLVIMKDLLLELSILYKGQKLLFRLTKIIENLSMENSQIYTYIYNSAKRGCYPTFIFWLNQLKNHKLKDMDIMDINVLICNSINNSDDRIFPYILKNINKNDIQILIKSIVFDLSIIKISNKLILRKIKILSEYIDLSEHFNILITNFCNNYDIIFKLYEFYYKKEYTYKELFRCINLFPKNMDYVIYNIKKLLKTEHENNLLYLVIFVLYDFVMEPDLKLTKELKRDIINNYSSIIDNIKDIILLHESPFAKSIIKLLVDNNLITKYVNENKDDNYQVLLFTKFAKTESHKGIIINKFLHLLRMFIKKKKRNKLINHNLKYYNILNEIKNFKPNKKYPVLKNGSINYQYDNQKFTIKYPELLLKKIDDLVVIKENISGLLVYSLPSIFNYEIKSKYIEDLDLYLVYDINIPNTTILERNNYLRKMHLYTKNYSLFLSYSDIIKEERYNIHKYLSETKDNTKWYPVYCHIDKIDCIKNINSDFIISSFDSNQEYKIKSVNNINFYLLYKNNRWFDNNNNDWTDKVKNNMKVKNFTIYKCKYDSNNFIPTEYIYYKNDYDNFDDIVKKIEYIKNSITI